MEKKRDEQNKNEVALGFQYRLKKAVALGFQSLLAFSRVAENARAGVGKKSMTLEVKASTGGGGGTIPATMRCQQGR